MCARAAAHARSRGAGRPRATRRGGARRRGGAGRRGAGGPDSPASEPARRRLALVCGSLLALAAAASLLAPWLSQLEVQSAARIWTGARQTAYARLRAAARLNPLSDEAELVAGSIALRYGELARADREFAMALSRSPGDAYATLERGAIASARGERAAAIALLERAVRLDPREPLAREALSIARAGRRVNIQALNRSILLKAQQLA